MQLVAEKRSGFFRVPKLAMAKLSHQLSRSRARPTIADHIQRQARHLFYEFTPIGMLPWDQSIELPNS